MEIASCMIYMWKVDMRRKEDREGWVGAGGEREREREGQQLAEEEDIPPWKSSQEIMSMHAAGRSRVVGGSIRRMVVGTWERSE